MTRSEHVVSPAAQINKRSVPIKQLKENVNKTTPQSKIVKASALEKKLPEEKAIVKKEASSDQTASDEEIKKEDSSAAKTLSSPISKRVVYNRNLPKKFIRSKENKNQQNSNSMTSPSTFFGSNVPAAQTYNVTERGEGDTFLLSEAIGLLKEGDKILLKKGSFKFNFKYPNIQSLTISGEGPGSVLETIEGINISGLHLTLKNLKLVHRGPGASIVVGSGKRVTLEDVAFQGEGNDGVKVEDGHINIKEVKFKNMINALEVRSPLSLLIDRLEVSDSDYALMIKNTTDIKINNFKTSNIRLFPVLFIEDKGGLIHCSECSLGRNPSNRLERLVIKQRSQTPR